MNCKKCKAEWTPPKGVSIDKCPFCGNPLFEISKSEKNAEPHEILLNIVQQYDKNKLGDTLLKGMLSDLMPHVEKKYQRIFKQALDDKIGLKLLEMENEDGSMQNIKLNTLRHSFKNNNGFDSTADYVIDCFLFALGWIETVNKEQYNQGAVDNLSVISKQIDMAFIDGVLQKEESAAIFANSQKLGLADNVIADLINAKIKSLKLESSPHTTKSYKSQKEIICASDWQPESKKKPNNNVKQQNFIISKDDMVFVPSGTFKMGEQPSTATYGCKPHSVTLNSYYIGKYPVTQKQWKLLMGNNPSHFKGDNLPVEKVSWNDVQEFIIRLNHKTGKNYRLPTEAEWEYAARGGNQNNGNATPNQGSLKLFQKALGINTSIKYTFSGSNDIEEVGWYYQNAARITHLVGEKKANKLGIYDMSGNVYEWCSDWYGHYQSYPKINPQGPTMGNRRVYRGGSFKTRAECCAVFFRETKNYLHNQAYSSNEIGFRLAMEYH